MSPVDEGLVHAWLDGQLPAVEAERVAQLVATDSAWASAAAEARGLIAGSSRILTALDEVPRVGSAGPITRAPWWKAPWIRAAASFVMVAGIAGAVWQWMPPTDDGRAPVMSPAVIIVDTPTIAARQATPPAPVQPPPAAASPPTEPPAAKAPGIATGRSVRAEARADAAARAEAAATAEARRVAPPVSLVEQGVVGAAGRNSLALQRAAINTALRGCWAQIDSAGTVQTFAFSVREADAVEQEIVGLRFIGPVVTDVVGSGVGGGRGSGAPVLASPVVPSFAAARIQLRARPTNAATRMLPDSGYVAEFLDARGRTEMSFTAQGDTLTGTLRRSAGDVRYPAEGFRAVRAVCPPEG